MASSARGLTAGPQVRPALADCSSCEALKGCAFLLPCAGGSPLDTKARAEDGRFSVRGPKNHDFPALRLLAGSVFRGAEGVEGVLGVWPRVFL